jgi:predicted GH43/DUF377 family glycosyl hydrolase
MHPTPTSIISFIITLIFLALSILILYLVNVRKKSSRELRDIIKQHLLTRFVENPILSPRDYLHWEKEGAFNPAAVEIDGKIHLLYRAVGGDGISRVGYAVSEDGLHFGAGDNTPVFAFEKPSYRSGRPERYDPVMYPSGGSYGGCEDPRVTKIGNTLYMTFNAFDGWDFIRIGLSMISEDDFLNKRWDKWTKTKLISPPNEIHKNWMLFPEKVKGKYAILHSISPKIEIEYRDSVTDIGSYTPFIKSPVGMRTKGSRDRWDARIRGAGPPPLKTSRGWLVIYHANEHNESHKYKLGAHLLDLYNPTKIIATSVLPVLEPDEWYENDSKPGIVYACGAIIKKDNNNRDSLYVYYGGGDKYVCVAHTDLDKLLDYMVEHGSIS